MNKKKEKYLRDVYYNTQNPAAFSGLNKLSQQIKKEKKYTFTQNEIKRWLQSQEVHTTNVLPKRKFSRNQVIAPYLNYQFDIDTASFHKFADKNDKYGYFILAIDIMSRYVWTRAIKTPSANETAKALETIFEEGRVPEKVRTDKGTEFTNSSLKRLYKKYKIKHFVTQNELKSNYAERTIQGFKSRLMKYMRSKQTYRWIDQLENITNAYNNSIHRSIKQTPASVSKKDEIKLWKLLYINSKKTPYPPKKFRFKVGDIVRISKTRKVFTRYYSEHWTNELFIIKKRDINQNIPVYTLTDYAGEDILGTFYEKELQKVHVDENTTYNIEKVIRNRNKNGIKESLIKWMGWPEKYNSWVPTKDIVKYK
jgi:Tfp pilus assembly major pilin PilA